MLEAVVVMEQFLGEKKDVQIFGGGNKAVCGHSLFSHMSTYIVFDVFLLRRNN